MTLHIAKSGISAGQLVSCDAKVSCRNGGRHINNVTANAVTNWINDENLSNDSNNPNKTYINTLSLEQVKDFDALPAATRNTYISKEVDRQVEASKSQQEKLAVQSKNDLLTEFTGKKPAVPAPPRKSTKQPVKTPPPTRPSAPNVAPLPPIPSTVPPVPGKFKRIPDGVPPRPSSL